MQSQMASTHQTVSHQVTNQSPSQQAVQFQTLQTYNTSILHPQPTRNIHTPKPPVGSDEWLKQRRANHKEVERRRRETINEGINELAKLIPEDEKNKGRIIARAVQYIQHLKEQEASNLEKWTLENSNDYLLPRWECLFFFDRVGVFKMSLLLLLLGFVFVPLPPLPS